MSNPLISVIIPIYNVESYLKECLDSVLYQTLQNIEIICINDGSTDNSKNILESYANYDKRIKLINKQNEGVAKARNEALLLAKGEFVCFIDPDDLYPSNKTLYSLYLKASTNKALICGGSFSEYFNGKINSYYDDKPLYYGYTFKKDGFIEYKDYQFDFGFHRFIYNRIFLLQNNILYPNYKKYEDPVFFVKAMILAKRFYATTEITYCYRVGHKDVSKWSKDMWNDQNKGLGDVLQLAKIYKLQNLHTLTINRANNIGLQLTKNIYNGNGFVSSLVFLNTILQSNKIQSKDSNNQPLELYFEKIDKAFKTQHSASAHLLMFIYFLYKPFKQFIKKFFRIRLFHKHYNIVRLFGYTFYEKINSIQDTNNKTKNKTLILKQICFYSTKNKKES